MSGHCTVSDTYRKKHRPYPSPREKPSAQPGWVQEDFLEEETVRQCPKARAVWQWHRQRELMSDSTKDFGLRVLAEVKKIPVYHPTLGFGG